MNYADYTVEDFLLDEQFRKWIVNPDRDDNMFWENWLKNNPEKSKDLTEARNILLNLSIKDYKLTSEERDEIWNGIQEKCDTDDVNTAETKVIPISAQSILKRSETAKKPDFQWLRIAAIFLVLVVGASVFLKINNSSVEVSENGVETMTEKVTELGVKSQITLSDGTMVILNAGSKLRYLPNFTSESRDVYLEGEAYFDVAKDSKRPFNVHSGDLVTTAIGTEFNVNEYQDENEGVSIALIEGKVEVRHFNNKPTDRSILLLPGDMATFHRRDEKIIISKFDAKEETAWKEGSLYFVNANEPQVFKRIERWYGVDIILENASEKKWDYSAEFRNQNIHQVLTSLSFTMSFEYRIENSNVYITFKNL